jgi:hypothetical protein
MRGVVEDYPGKFKSPSTVPTPKELDRINETVAVALERLKKIVAEV